MEIGDLGRWGIDIEYFSGGGTREHYRYFRCSSFMTRSEGKARKHCVDVVFLLAGSTSEVFPALIVYYYIGAVLP